ncbi:DNA polymerase III subunit alpha [Filobacillus milosensis]|uniref:DNA polymerase III subunit alpha n=1 Tax=Filobacillus milosensis TaxID=94137 RepID=UPI001891C137|nr:DNA polymerase III subunit alpha [Filobacillus milosensis]
MSFVHLQVKSSFSFLRSTIKINSYVQKAKELGFSACSIADHEVLHGAYEFYQACRKVRLKPLIGMSIDLYIGNDQRPVTLYIYAKNAKGYQSLVHLSNLRKLHSVQITLKHIEECEGIIPIVSFYNTYVEELIYLDDQSKISEIVSLLNQSLNTWYVSVEPITSRKELVTNWIESRENIYSKAILMNDVRYLREKDRIGYESLYAIDQSSSLVSIRREVPKGIHLLTEDELNEKLDHKWEQSKQLTNVIAEQCDIELPDQWFGLPSFPDTKGLSSAEHLREICVVQISRLYKTEQDAAMKRLNHELNVIESMNFSDYFLIVKDIVDYAKRENILIGPGRGSAAGSIVAYLLGIIEVDPLKYDLLFERFLNPERMGMPDIDIDFSDYRRDEVINYVARRYGSEHVAQIMTFGTFQARSTVRELSKVFQIEKDQLTFILKQLSHQASSLKDLINNNNELKEYIKQSSSLREMFQAALIIEGLPRHYSTHAAGIVISDQPMSDYVPVVQGQDLVMLTQYPMQQLEAVGLLKMDLLGLRNLTLLERMIKQVEENEGKSINLNKLPFNDLKTFELLRKGFTTGVFQLESDGMKKALKAIKPNQLEDIVAVNALFRPGPMQFIETFAKRKHGKEPITYIHQDLENILKSTYGVLVYQEQIMQAVNQFAGFSLGQADLLRRAISKKDAQAIQQMKEDFINGSQEQGYEQATAIELFNWIERFANYGFNKSHAVAYSIISYQTAYFKANYPEYFYAELLSSVMHDHDKLEKYINEARQQGIKLLPPSINRSFGKFTVEAPKQIRFGFLAIKNVGKQAYDEIIFARKDKPYKDLFDFCKRVNLKTINQSVIETLILAGAFDETRRHRAQLLSAVMPAIEQGDLFSDMDDQLNWSNELFDMDIEYPDVDPFPVIKQLNMEKEVLGFIISPHPLSYIRRALKRKGMLTIKESIARKGSYVFLIASISSIHHIRTKRGEQMAFLTIRDETEEIDSVMFPKLHREVHRWLEEDLFIQIKGKVDERNGKTQIILNEIHPFEIDQLPKTSDAQIFIRIGEGNEQAYLNKIYDISKQYEGNTPVVIYDSIRNRTYQLSEQYDLPEDENVISELNHIFNEENVKIKRTFN